MKPQLTAEMGSEIDRLGLERRWFQWVADEQGLEFCRFCLAQRTKEAKLFDLWYPRLVEFAKEKRSQSPFPAAGELSSMEAATLRILAPKVRDSEGVPCQGNFTAAIFTAPLHVLPLVAALWTANYRHPVFLTPGELTEWRTRYDSEEVDQEAWWFVFQHWDAEPNPPADSFWLRDSPLQVPEGFVPVLVTYGLCWGSLAGGENVELWGIDAAGQERFLRDVGVMTY